jgi:predicted DCC family thiol-disulfide oxidoreductase YuxK
VADAPAPTFLYDGDCAFCSTCAHFIERRIPTSARVVPWQRADLANLGVTQAEAEAAVQWVDGTGRPAAAGPAGIARLLVDAGSFWRPLGWVLGFAPIRAVAWPVYRLVSRNRHRLPGGSPACSLPQAERDGRRAATANPAAEATPAAPVTPAAPADAGVRPSAAGPVS